jgi:hypothetical protein
LEGSGINWVQDFQSQQGIIPIVPRIPGWGWSQRRPTMTALTSPGEAKQRCWQRFFTWPNCSLASECSPGPIWTLLCEIYF